jgi:hypothetical protein
MYLGNQPALSFTSFAKQDFTTSATTSYTLDNPVANANELALFINFVRQEPTTAYTATGTSLTLTSATSASDDMYCVFLGKAVQTVNPPSGSVGTAQIADLAVTSGKLASGVLPDNTPAFRVYLGSTQTISDNTSTVVQYNTENFDTDSAYDTSTYRFTVPSGKAGKYFFSAHAYVFQSGASLYSSDIAIRKNGTNQSADNLGLDSSDNYGYILKTTTILDLSVADYVDVVVGGNTNDGGTLSIFNTSPYQFSVFQGYKLIG